MTSAERLAKAIGYPEDVSGEAITLQVDDGGVLVREEGGRLILERVLCRPEDGSGALARLAGFAAGRLLKEESALAWDPRENAVILWQDMAANAADGVLKRVFEVFCTSCDWWVARVGETGGAPKSFPSMMIMP